MPTAADRNGRLRRLLVAAGFALASTTAPAANADETGGAIPVELVETDDGWSLLRGGEPYFIKGAGGDRDLDILVAAGANSIRTWGADDIGGLLDAAHARGLSVTVGIWLGHERHGFDYGDDAMVAAQLERVRQTVLRYRDHPAVLIWALGNEMEGFEDGGDARVWAAVNDAAALVQSLDPNHPTMTVTAEIGGERVRYVHEYCTAIDIHGINSYGGAPSLPERLRAAGGSKPYVITEFGPRGPWESPETDWGAPLEATSAEKAAHYARSYRNGVLAAPGRALGSYVFPWGAKMEGTETWFGMFLRDGAELAPVETMRALWGGAPKENRAPTIEPIAVEGGLVVDPGARLTAQVALDDPDGDEIDARWVLQPESGDYLTGGDLQARPVPVDGAILAGDERGATVAMPDEPGAYRLFVFARDGNGNAAAANVPLLVRGETANTGPQFPVYVYEDGFAGMPWAPSGWMGAIDAMTLDDRDATNPYTGDYAIRLRLEGNSGYGAIAWQHPPNDWGDAPGGFDLTGAGALELWARGEYGGEQVKFGVGLLGSENSHPDSLVTEVDGITLTDQWQRFEIPLRGKDLTQVKTGFVVALVGRRSSVTVYLDRIRYVR